MSGAWLQFAGALALMYLLVISAGVWAKRRRAQLGRDNRKS